MVIGLNHRTAPVAVRERFWISENRRLDALLQLARAEGIEEVAVLATWAGGGKTPWGHPPHENARAPDDAPPTTDASIRSAVRTDNPIPEPPFWGVEEMNWTSAPALSEKNFHRHFGSRTFDFYYSGAHLHMVVLREHGATV